MLLETSQDLLFIVLAICVLWFTVFLCWLIYQMARVLKNANDIIESVQEKLEIIVDAVMFIKEKVEKMTSGMGVVSTIVSKFAEQFITNAFKGTDMDIDLEERMKKKSKPKRKRATKSKTISKKVTPKKKAKKKK